MKIISHRGNLSGRNEVLENSPDFIDTAMSQGFDVEIDLWIDNDGIYLGHDAPTYQVSHEWIGQRFESLWIHAKNTLAIEYLSKTKYNWFWHENDLITITSHGNIWANIGVFVENGITVQLGYSKLPNSNYGVCTDTPTSYLLDDLGYIS
jgi:hypothetical protein